jgi:phage gp29-like protein
MVTILDQFGRPFESAKKPDQRVIAAAPLTDSWRDYVAAGLTPGTLASVLREADAGDVRRQSELYGQIEEKDGHLIGETGKRKNAILDIEFAVRPASEDARDVKIADFVQEYLDNLTDYDDILVSLQDAVGKGFAMLEIGWETSSGQALPSGFEWIDQKRAVFWDDKNVLSKIPRIVTDIAPMGAEIPAWKVLFHRYGGKSGHPTRSGIYRVAAWMHLFKNYALKDWVVFCEVYGMPLRLGKYDPAASKNDKDALIAAISSLGSDAAGVISKSTEIQFVESVKGKANGDLYEALITFCNKEISKALLGATLTADVGDVGSYAASRTHNEVRLDLAKADTKAVAATIRHQLIRPIVGFNFGWDAACPDYEPVWEEEENLKEKSDWIGALMDRGVQFPASFIRTEFNIPEPEDGEEMLGRGNAPQTQPGIEFAKRGPGGWDEVVRTAKASKIENAAAGDDPTPITQLTDRMDAESAPAWKTILDHVRRLAEEANDMNALRDSLLTAYADLPVDGLAKVMAAGFAAADLAGRFDVTRESE